MAPLLRQKKRSCFYCGQRTAQCLPIKVRQWKCESCEAPNFLDENGEIADPPALEYTAGKRFARPPELSGTENTLFCRRCVQNQHLLTESLASYFPSPNAPDYLTYEANYPNFRESLEERYPQVCRDCAPKVDQRIRDTGYAAKTDHLRRMMDRTRRGQHGNRWGWKQLLVNLGLFLWCASFAGQILWHAMGALTIAPEPGVFQDENKAASLGSCFHRGLHLEYVESDCTRVYQSSAGLAMVMGALSIVWNPKLGEKLRRKEGRLVGLIEYYKLQVLLLVMKIVAWLALGNGSSFNLELQTIKAAHAVMIVFSILISVVSFQSVQIDYTPRFSFQENHKSLLPQHPTTGAVPGNPDLSRIESTSLINVLDKSGLSFPITQLAASGQGVRPAQYRPPTPPPEESEVEPMDWSPIHTPFRTPSIYQPQQQSQQPTQPPAFCGSLPQNVQSQAQRIRNLQEPIYRRTSLPKQKSSFKGTNTQISLRPNKSTDLSSNLDVRFSPGSALPIQSPLIAPPRFFAPSDRQAATGLESLFSTTFTVKEEPTEVQRAQQVESKEPSPQPVSEVIRPSLSIMELSYHRRITGILIVLATLFWPVATASPYLDRLCYLFSMGAASIVATLNLFHVLQENKDDWSLSDALVFGCELLVTLFLINTVIFSPSFPMAIGKWLLYLMLVQEMWIIWQEMSTSRNTRYRHLQRDALELLRRGREGEKVGKVGKVGRGDGMW